jgi:hypothetical protein
MTSRPYSRRNRIVTACRECHRRKQKVQVHLVPATFDPAFREKIKLIYLSAIAPPHATIVLQEASQGDVYMPILCKSFYFQSSFDFFDLGQLINAIYIVPHLTFAPCLGLYL